MFNIAPPATVTYSDASSGSQNSFCDLRQLKVFSEHKIPSYIPATKHILQVGLGMSGKAVVFGAGKVGLSLVGLVFSKGGYEVVFVDVVDDVVNELNKRREYTIEVKDVHSEIIRVQNVRAVNAKNSDQVAEEVATADILATVVGVNNLPFVYPNIAKGLLRREKERRPLDIVICENLRNSSKLFRQGLLQNLPKEYPSNELVGLVETSTDKMVPDMPREMRQKDPLLVYAEAFSTLVVDKKAFKGRIPTSPILQAKENIQAYFDRKFFTLNTGHAVAAYVGYLTGFTYIWEAMGDQKVRRIVENSMRESDRALIAEYPGEFSEKDQKEYIEGLLTRFSNKALNDTIYRVGRDLLRKLSRNDRLIGAMLLEARHRVSSPYTTLGTAAAMLFRATDENGQLFPEDKRFVEEIYPKGLEHVLQNVCRLDPDTAEERTVMKNVKKTYEFLSQNPANSFLYNT